MGRDLSGANAQAVKEFCLEVKLKLMTNVLDVRVFGSVARGTATPESDIDVLVLLESKHPNVRDIIAEIALEINLKYDVVISPVIMSKDHYSNSLFQETAFFRNLEQEGVSI
ncbi:MAG: nucleotidyltransferase family protein [Desulfitobacteriaceae bacterium]